MHVFLNKLVKVLMMPPHDVLKQKGKSLKRKVGRNFHLTPNRNGGIVEFHSQMKLLRFGVVQYASDVLFVIIPIVVVFAIVVIVICQDGF